MPPKNQAFRAGSMNFRRAGKSGTLNGIKQLSGRKNGLYRYHHRAGSYDRVRGVLQPLHRGSISEKNPRKKNPGAKNPGTKAIFVHNVHTYLKRKQL